MIQYVALAGMVANSPVGKPLHKLGKMLSPLRLLGEDVNNQLHDPAFNALKAYGKGITGGGSGMAVLGKFGLGG